MNNEILSNLIQTYLRAKASGELGDETRYHDKIESYRTWLRESILDQAKLANYTDQEFAIKFGEMYDHTDGSASSHALNLGIHFKSDKSRINTRASFENMIAYINNPDNDRFNLLEDIKTTDSLKISGLGDHIITSLINAKYPDVAPVNGTTKEFFVNIGQPLPANISDAQQTVNEFLNDAVNISKNTITLDDANLIFWYTKSIDSGREFMKRNFNVIPKTKSTRKPSRTRTSKPRTREEILAETIAHLQAIHDQAMRDKNQPHN